MRKSYVSRSSSYLSSQPSFKILNSDKFLTRDKRSLVYSARACVCVCKQYLFTIEDELFQFSCSKHLVEPFHNLVKSLMKLLVK